MKIIFLSDDFPPQSFGGAGISTFDLALGVKKAGHDVHVITTVRKDHEEGRSYYGGFTIWKIKSEYSEKWRAFRGLYNPPVIGKLKKILKELKPDIIHVNNVHYHLSYYAIKISARYAHGVVMTLRDAMSFSFGKLRTEQYFKHFNARMNLRSQFMQARWRWNPIRNFSIRMYLSYADKIFTVSDALKRAVEQNGIWGTQVMHTGTDIAMWNVSEELITAFKKEHNLIDKKIILYSGRLTASKGAGIARSVLEKIKDVMPNAALLVAGEGDSILEKENIVYTGWINREKMKIAYAVADVVLVPSLCFDAFPRAVLEGMASGKPVVGTRYGGAEEAIIDGTTGYIINPFDVEETTEKILDLLIHQKKAIEFGEAGRSRVNSAFNSAEKIRQLVSCYTELVGK